MTNKTVTLLLGLAVFTLCACEPGGEIVEPAAPGCRTVTLTVNGPITNNGKESDPFATRENTTIRYHFSRGRCDSIVVIDRQRTRVTSPRYILETQRWAFEYSNCQLFEFKYKKLRLEDDRVTEGNDSWYRGRLTNNQGELLYLFNDYNYFFSPNGRLIARLSRTNNPTLSTNIFVHYYAPDGSLSMRRESFLSVFNAVNEHNLIYAPFNPGIYLDSVFLRHPIGLSQMPLWQGTGMTRGNCFIALNVLDNPGTFQLDYLPASGYLYRHMGLTRWSQQLNFFQELEYTGNRVTGIVQRWPKAPGYPQNFSNEVRITAVERRCD